MMITGSGERVSIWHRQLTADRTMNITSPIMSVRRSKNCKALCVKPSDSVPMEGPRIIVAQEMSCYAFMYVCVQGCRMSARVSSPCIIRGRSAWRCRWGKSPRAGRCSARWRPPNASNSRRRWSYTPIQHTAWTWASNLREPCSEYSLNTVSKADLY